MGSILKVIIASGLIFSASFSFATQVRGYQLHQTGESAGSPPFFNRLKQSNTNLIASYKEALASKDLHSHESSLEEPHDDCMQICGRSCSSPPVFCGSW